MICMLVDKKNTFAFTCCSTSTGNWGQLACHIISSLITSSEINPGGTSISQNLSDMNKERKHDLANPWSCQWQDTLLLNTEKQVSKLRQVSKGVCRSCKVSHQWVKVLLFPLKEPVIMKIYRLSIVELCQSSQHLNTTTNRPTVGVHNYSSSSHVKLRALGWSCEGKKTPLPSTRGDLCDHWTRFLF